ncbi:DUF2797 domain-containing protein [Sulfidibacter corallicola]|uniref:DUF2797 domain-containing protein n=1 Tax=Sulfidibacter corallicola TaxID=2818388 RepID=A0A8A4TSY0_SULCO|nr:DUF2797 domain-containing protein [Sulfidibacter corallicola]QTD52178.1 DUF2797 domain-containing protein [Sulfidibacter corallicola]
METYSGHLSKMATTLAEPVQYEMCLDQLRVPMNTYLGRTIGLTFSGRIECAGCGRKIKKSYHQGYCYPCTQTLAECDTCIVRPELCHFAQGTCRQPDWGEARCMKPHYVYLANSSGIKVGITRETQIPTRWIDQGAIQALPILKVGTRLVSGLSEVLFKRHVADKTNWRKMLKGEVEERDLVAARDELMEKCRPGLEELVAEHGPDAVTPLPEATETRLDFPVLEFPTKVTSLNLDKTPEIGGVLKGIKGQYLILSTGVINIRKYGGYHVTFSA